jgi:two-component system response regulator YesN
MRGKWKKTNWGLTLHYLIPYLIILCIPLFTGFITYQHTLSVVESDIRNHNILLLEKSKETLDRRLSEMDSIITQVARDTKVVQFLNVHEPFEGAYISRLLEMKAGLFNYSLTNNFISASYILFKNSNLVLTSDNVYKMPYFFQFVLKDKEFSELEFYQALTEETHHKKVIPARQMIIEGAVKSMVVYSKLLGYPSKPLGTVAVLIEEKELQKQLTGLDISDGGWAYIADEDGNIITYISTLEDQSRPPLLQLDSSSGFTVRSDQMITYTTSQANNWQYVVSQPAHIVFQKANYIKKITFTIVFISMLAGMVFALWLATKSSRPVRSLFQLLSGHLLEESEGGTFGQIQGTVRRLVSNVEEMKATFERQMPVLRAAFIESLLKGEFYTMEDILSVMEYSGTSIRGKLFVIALLQLHPYDMKTTKEFLHQLDIDRFVIKELMLEQFPELQLMHNKDQDKLVFLFSFEMKSDDAIRSDMNVIAQSIVQRLKATLPLTLKISIGGIYEGLLDISRSFEEAKSALQQVQYSDSNDIVIYDLLPQPASSYTYSPEMEIRLMNYTKAGDTLEVEKLLGELFDENFSRRRLTSEQVRLFVYDMIGTIVKTSEQMMKDDLKLQAVIKELVNQGNAWEHIDQFKETILMVCLQICEHMNLKKVKHQYQLIEQIQTYIQEFYRKGDVSLTVISGRFNMSEAYFSQVFKEQAGINFFDYVESIRMKHAICLLGDSDLPVKEIAEHIGYGSLNTFSRAFKRYYGTSPSHYRSSRNNE